MNSTLNRISDELEFDIGTLEVLELSTDRSFWDVSSWPADRVDRSVRRLLSAGSKVRLSGVIDDDYNPRRVFDITVKEAPHFEVDFGVSYNWRRFPAKVVASVLSSRG